jgi:hypothetical protein
LSMFRYVHVCQMALSIGDEVDTFSAVRLHHLHTCMNNNITPL